MKNKINFLPERVTIIDAPGHIVNWNWPHNFIKTNEEKKKKT